MYMNIFVTILGFLLFWKPLENIYLQDKYSK